MRKQPVIFLAFANDHIDYLYKLTEEQQAIREALRPLVREGLCEVVYETDTDLDKIWNTFNDYRDRIAIFHYGGHAEDYSLLLKKSSGERELAHGEGLVSFLGQQKGLQLVFINGCCTKRQAEELRDRGVPAVIGTSEPVNDAAATQLSATFYRGLAAGRSLQQAWLGARDLVRARRGAGGYQRSIKIREEAVSAKLSFPWELYMRRGAEQVQEWNLPRAASNPLFGLPLPESYFLRLSPSPYVGLHFFRENDAAIFFGRGAQIRELYNHIQGIHPIILMFGKSGVGKSSMLGAGLIPRIRDAYEVSIVRRIQEKGLLGTLDMALDELLEGRQEEATNERSLAELGSPQKLEDARKLLRAAADKAESDRLRRQIENLLGELDLEESPVPAPSIPLSGILGKWQAVEAQTQKPLIIILDQVEEKFTRPQPGLSGPESDELVTLLAAIQPLFSGSGSGIRGKLILSYRKEVHPEIRDTLRTMSLPFAELFLKRLDREGIIEAIRGINQQDITRRQYQLKIEDSLPGIIADDLVEDPESPIAPVLQIILEKLWHTAAGEEGQPVHLTVQQYQELRKQGTTMGEFFQQQMAQLAAEFPELNRSGLVLSLLHAHTTAMGTSGSCRSEHLFHQYQVGADRLRALIQKLEDLSLLVRLSNRQGAEPGSFTTILSHDTLAPVVIREYNLSDAPGQRAARILSNKTADVGYRLQTDYLDKLRHLGTDEATRRELAIEYIGRDKFLSVLRTSLGEERFREDRSTLLETAVINLHPGGRPVYLDEADLAIVEEGAGLASGFSPGMRRLLSDEEQLVAESRRRRVERIRQEQEQLEKERRAARIQQQLLRGISAALVVAIFLGFLAYQQYGEAQENFQTAQENLDAALANEYEKVNGEVEVIRDRVSKLDAGSYRFERRKLLERADSILQVYKDNHLLDDLRGTVSADLENLSQN